MIPLPIPLPPGGKPAYPPVRRAPMTRREWLRRAAYRSALATSLAATLSLTGCLGFLKPVADSPRRFLLASIEPAEPGGRPSPRATIGLGAVRVATYLLDTGIVVRRGPTEIDYLPRVLWAERLDQGVQRVLAASLENALPAVAVRLSSWRPADVVAEIHVRVEQLDVDTAGHGELRAGWRIVNPGNGQTLVQRDLRLRRDGPTPEADPAGTVATLSALVSDLGTELSRSVGGVVTLPP